MNSSCACISKTFDCRPSIGHERKMHLVVAHCKEDLNWIQTYNFSSVSVFEKCNFPSYHSHVTYKDSIGREAHSYLRFVVENYEKIEAHDFYAFLQGHAPKEIQYSPLAVNNISRTLSELSAQTVFAGLSGLITRPESSILFPRRSIRTLRGQFVVRGSYILKTSRTRWMHFLRYATDHPALPGAEKNVQKCAADCVFEASWNLLFYCDACGKKPIPWGRHKYTNALFECYE